MNEFHCSARGQSAQTWLDIPKGRRTKLPYPPIKILFPTVQYVRDSVAGERVRTIQSAPLMQSDVQ